MSLAKFKKRRPFEGLVNSEFFDMENFFDNRLWNQGLFNDNYWNGRKGEPALNIKENETDFEIELAAPGFDKKDFKITIDESFLNIKAEKSSEDEEKEDDYTRKEFSYQAFERTLQLPENVKEEKIKAKYKNGILNFKIEKLAEVDKPKPKIVEIA